MTSGALDKGSLPNRLAARAPIAVIVALLAVTACQTTPAPEVGLVATTAAVEETSPSVSNSASATSASTSAVSAPGTNTVTRQDPGLLRPDWLGRRPLPTSPDGMVVTPQTTPEELRDRRLPTIDTLPAPVDDRFIAAVGPIPDDVLARSTWVDGCPVAVDELAYLTMTFWGFDDRPHTGEMIVHAEQAENVVEVFEKLHTARFPIEEMRVVSPADLDAEPTGDGNNTTGFVCRAVTGGSRFSEHAYGLAIDLNPFHNPYQRGDLVLPELAADYLDRSSGLPGAVVAGDVAFEAFAAIGWAWGGDWRSLKDYQHFALNNR